MGERLAQNDGLAAAVICWLMALRTSCLILAVSLSLGIGGAAQRNAVRNQLLSGSRLPKPPVFKPLTPAGKAQIFSMKHVLPNNTATTRYYDVQHAYDSFGSLYLMNASQVSFGENFAEFESGSGSLSSFFKPIAVRQKHLIIFTINAPSSSTVSLQAGGEDNSWNAPNETVPLHTGTNHVPLVVQPKSNVPVKVIVQAGNTTFFFEKMTVELVTAKP